MMAKETTPSQRQEPVDVLQPAGQRGERQTRPRQDQREDGERREQADGGQERLEAPVQRAALARAQDGDHLEAVARQAGNDDQGEGELEGDGGAGWSRTQPSKPAFSKATEASARRRLWMSLSVNMGTSL